MKELTLKEMIDLTGAATGKIFRKKILEKIARPAKAGETIVTSIRGEVETKQTLTSNNYMVVTGLSGEEYAMPISKFDKLYEKVAEGIYHTKPDRIKAVKVEEKLTFIAPWGESMIANPEDFIAYRSPSDAYRIEGEEFAKTYTSTLSSARKIDLV